MTAAKNAANMRNRLTPTWVCKVLPCALRRRFNKRFPDSFWCGQEQFVGQPCRRNRPQAANMNTTVVSDKGLRPEPRFHALSNEEDALPGCSQQPQNRDRIDLT